jgi:glutamate--cysteine ligase
MMRLTSSVQVNLDYTSEAEAIEMLRVALAVAPVSYALFANSPLLEGKETGYLSYRAAIWRETDPDRTGLLLRAFQPDFDFSAYGEFVWFRPLMFAQDRAHHYLSAEGLALADIAAGKLSQAPLDEPNQINGVREIFTEARLKPGYVEVRSIDGLGSADRMAAAAFWLGLLYSSEARRLALELLKPFLPDRLEQLWEGASRDGLRTQAGGIDMISVARRLVTTAQATLEARGYGEEKFLAPALKNIEARENPADQILKGWRGPWKQSMEALVAHCGK